MKNPNTIVNYGFGFKGLGLYVWSKKGYKYECVFFMPERSSRNTNNMRGWRD